MDNLLTGLNGGNVPALELIFMITIRFPFYYQ